MSTQVKAHITGTVWKILVKPGDHVEEDDTLVILESMKMEMPIEASDDATVVSVAVHEGQAIKEDALVLTLELDDEA